MLVIDELDKAKDNRGGGVSGRARQITSSIWKHFKDRPEQPWIIRPATPESGQVSIELLKDPPQHVRLTRSDDELIERALALQTLRGQSVHFLTYDTGAALRAELVDVPATRLQPETQAPRDRK